MHDPISKVSRSAAIRVLLLAEYGIVLESLGNLLHSSQHISVSSALSPAMSDDPDIAQNAARCDVAVVYLSDGVRIEIVPRLLESNPNIRILVIAAAIRSGAVGILQKTQNYKFLIEAIRQIYRGETWLNQALFHRILENGKPSGSRRNNTNTNGNGHSDPGPDSLTMREIQVLQLIGEGLSNRALATRLNISEATVRHHLSSIYDKIGADDRVNMVIRAYEKGLLSDTKSG